MAAAVELARARAVRGHQPGRAVDQPVGSAHVGHALAQDLFETFDQRVELPFGDLFLAFGLWLCILGGECLFVERAVLADSVAAPPPVLSADGTFSPPGTRQEIQTQEWMPWSLLGLGTVIILYTFTLPKRSKP